MHMAKLLALCTNLHTCHSIFVIHSALSKNALFGWDHSHVKFSLPISQVPFLEFLSTAMLFNKQKIVQ